LTKALARRSSSLKSTVLACFNHQWPILMEVCRGAISLQAQPSGSAAAEQDFSERSAVNMVAGRTLIQVLSP